MNTPVTSLHYVGFAVTFVVICLMFIYPKSYEFRLGTTNDSGEPAVMGNIYLSVPIQIEARGKRFEWSFRYPGRDGELGTSDDFRSDKELHLPLETDVALKLESDDFIYIMSNSGLGLKQIAVPELTHTLKFHTAKIGRFELLTDPLCGWRPLHDDLMGRVIVHSVTDFNDWFKKKVADPVSNR
jgi:heme/copper-type cytochrome/quinol oxidase subunit 2